MELSRREFILASGGMLLWQAGVRAEGFSPLCISQICDPQLGFGGYDHDKESFRLAVAQINVLKPDFVVICGDLVNDASSDEAIADFLAIKAGLTAPCLCAPGNHDIGNEPTSQTLARYRKRIGPDYLTVESKGFQVVVVNTQLWKSPLEGESGRHEAWVRATLKSARENQRPVIVVGHYPLYVNEPCEGDEYFSLPPAKRAELLDLYEDSGVVAILSGHTHRQCLHNHKGMALITSAACSRNFDTAALGYRHVCGGLVPRRITYEYLPIKGAGPAEVP